MTEGTGLERARLVVELGPGTGVFTDAILARLTPGARLVAVELNPVLAARLPATRRDTRLTVVEGSAAELAAAVGEPVDAVVSGLPWTVMPRQRRGHIARVGRPRHRGRSAPPSAPPRLLPASGSRRPRSPPDTRNARSTLPVRMRRAKRVTRGSC
ncbi:rRNA adenine N-6-methyltransferase family protein [Streptomyces sp. NPDC048254]|uniref:rRNA adenine N-6-methyltransferase family protein n=1 Tax=Streptomyces sp. NPDC048254 TaxID=3365525 RepID=UPI003710A1B7